MKQRNFSKVIGLSNVRRAPILVQPPGNVKMPTCARRQHGCCPVVVGHRDVRRGTTFLDQPFYDVQMPIGTCRVQRTDIEIISIRGVFNCTVQSKKMNNVQMTFPTRHVQRRRTVRTGTAHVVGTIGKQPFHHPVMALLARNPHRCFVAVVGFGNVVFCPGGCFGRPTTRRSNQNDWSVSGRAHLCRAATR